MDTNSGHVDTYSLYEGTGRLLKRAQLGCWHAQRKTDCHHGMLLPAKSHSHWLIQGVNIQWSQKLRLLDIAYVPAK